MGQAAVGKNSNKNNNNNSKTRLRNTIKQKRQIRTGNRVYDEAFFRNGMSEIPRELSIPMGFEGYSKQGHDRGYFHTSIKPSTDKATEVLFSFDGQYGGTVAPADSSTSNASACTQKINSNTIPNGNGTSTSFESWVIHQASPKYPVFMSSGGGFICDSAVIEGEGDGNAWGLMVSEITNPANALMSYTNSDFQGEGGAQVWGMSVSNGQPITFSTDDAIDARIDIINGNTLVTVGGGNATPGTSYVFTPLADYYAEFRVTITGAESRWKLEVDADYGVATGPRCLVGVVPSNASALASNVVRVNSSALLLTNCQNLLEVSGSVLCARFSESQAPVDPIDTYMYQQEKSYLGIWKYGAFSPVFYCPPASDPFQSFGEVPYNGFAFSDRLVNVFHITSTLNSARNNVQCQLKLSQWTDYKSSSQLVTKFNCPYDILWPRVVAYANMMTRPTDNPDHIDLLRKIKEFVKYAASDQPVPAFIRKSLKTLGKEAIKFAPEALALLA